MTAATRTGAFVSCFCLFAACGGGQPATVQRLPAPFHAIEIGGSMKVSVDDGGPEVRLTGLRGGVPEPEVRGGVLVLGSGATRAAVRTAALRRIDVSADGEVEVDLGGLRRERLEIAIAGAGRVSIRGVDAGLLRVEAAGAARVGIAGRAGRLELAADGVGDVDLEKLCVETADIAVDGAGRVAIVATVRLDARVEGVGLLRAFAPHDLPEADGVGAVERLDDAGSCGP